MCEIENAPFSLLLLSARPRVNQTRDVLYDKALYTLATDYTNVWTLRPITFFLFFFSFFLVFFFSFFFYQVIDNPICVVCCSWKYSMAFVRRNLYSIIKRDYSLDNKKRKLLNESIHRNFNFNNNPTFVFLTLKMQCSDAMWVVTRKKSIYLEYNASKRLATFILKKMQYLNWSRM